MERGIAVVWPSHLVGKDGRNLALVSYNACQIVAARKLIIMKNMSSISDKIY